MVNVIREIWLPVDNFDGYYISNLGRVLSTKRKFNIILKPRLSKFGYHRVRLFNSNGDAWVSVHRLVAEAFIPNPDHKPQVNHIDEDKTNNRVDNLEWVTPKENTNHGTRNLRAGRRISEIKRIPILQIKDNKIIRRWDSAYTAQKILGINQANITKCCKGKRRTTGGYEWRYERKELTG